MCHHVAGVLRPMAQHGSLVRNLCLLWLFAHRVPTAPHRLSIECLVLLSQPCQNLTHTPPRSGVFSTHTAVIVVVTGLSHHIIKNAELYFLLFNVGACPCYVMCLPTVFSPWRQHIIIINEHVWQCGGFAFGCANVTAPYTLVYQRFSFHFMQSLGNFFFFL